MGRLTLVAGGDLWCLKVVHDYQAERCRCEGVKELVGALCGRFEPTHPANASEIFFQISDTNLRLKHKLGLTKQRSSVDTCGHTHTQTHTDGQKNRYLLSLCISHIKHIYNHKYLSFR